MSWKDFTNRAKDWVKEKSAELFPSKEKPYSDLGNGGSSGYYPGVAARQERTQRMAAMKEEAAQQAQQTQAMEGQTFQGAAMQQGYTQQFQGGYQQQPWPQQDSYQQPQDNISFMPGMYVDGSRAYAHVERITQLVSFQACYRIIEFMKNGESVIVNTESIPKEAEVIRCIDMLSGAAYTLGCSITKITNIMRAYLISPPTVQVLADVFIQRMSDRRNDEGARRRTGRYADEPSRSYAGEDAFNPGGYDPAQMASGYGYGQEYAQASGGSYGSSYGGYGAASSFAQ